ncbi:hypothetical protein BaRGS_00002832 [Batillaria attramentaria]|uniref:Uncharacterized protein n=1 Tax=Batillaria attramentaria TaxID=370345 RepID=A0ABD0M2W9_9CAEN
MKIFTGYCLRSPNLLASHIKAIAATPLTLTRSLKTAYDTRNHPLLFQQATWAVLTTGGSKVERPLSPRRETQTNRRKLIASGLQIGNIDKS